MNPSISIVVPAFNEETRLPGTLRRITEYLKASRWTSHEILVVDDGSTKPFTAADPAIRVLRNPGNRGKGYSVRHGMLEAKGDWRLFTDADLSAPIEELDELWAAVQEKNCEIAIGSRALNPSLIGIHQPGFRETAGRFFNAVMRVATSLDIADTQCGFKLFRGDVARELFSRQTLERFGFDVEVLYIAKKLGFKIAEVPVHWNHVEGSKVGMLNGLEAFIELAGIRLNDIKGRYS